jgi:Zn-dependent protease with chaperone function
MVLHKILELSFRLLYLAGTLMLERPFIRMQELEADSVGMGLAAKACFNLTNGISYYARIWNARRRPYGLSEAFREPFRRHPHSTTRVANLLERVPSALAVRNESICFPCQ